MNVDSAQMVGEDGREGQGEGVEDGWDTRMNRLIEDLESRVAGMEEQQQQNGQGLGLDLGLGMGVGTGTDGGLKYGVEGWVS